jgi:hypothetical protein
MNETLTLTPLDLARDLRYALDPVSFADSLNLGYELDPWQRQVLAWKGRQILLNCHRQSGKSTVAGILALYEALYRPGLILLISPSLRQSSELFRKVTGLLDRLEVKPQLVEDNKLSCELSNGARIISLPSSEGTIRGFSGARLIIEDEAAWVDDDLYFAIRPMLAISKGRLMLMSTPFGKRGHFYKEWTSEGDGWERIKVTVDQCSRISKDFLEEERSSMGEWRYKQEYMGIFVESEDHVFDLDLVMSQTSKDIKPMFSGRSFFGGEKFV